MISILPSPEISKAVGATISISAKTATQPFASVTEYEYVPAPTENDPVPVYYPVPPLAVIVMMPLFCPLQITGTVVFEADSKAGSVIVKGVDPWHPFASR